MTLAEALYVLRTEDLNNREAAPRVQAAFEALRSHLQQMVRRVTDSSEHWDVAVSSVYEKLEDQILSGDLPEILLPASYLRKALKWRVLDLVRRSEVARRHAGHEDAIRAAAQAEVEEAGRREGAWRSLSEMYDIVKRTTDERYRESQEQAMRTLHRIHERGDTLKEALIAEEPALEHDPEALARAAARLHKAQQRVREVIAAETKAQVQAGRLASDEGEDILWLLRSLRRRRPNRVESRVTRVNESES